MANSEKALIEILKASMEDHKIKYTEADNINWKDLINESRVHQISPLVYHTLEKCSLELIEKSIINNWRKEIFIVNIIQIRHIKEIVKIAQGLREMCVEIIVLKGIVLRNLYSVPELRTMSDGDILIHKEDFKKVKNYLITIGYECGPDDNKIHRGFTHPNKLEIEVHWKLINDDYFNGNLKSFEEIIWDRIIPFNIESITTNTLCIEDFFIHLFFHMVVHARYSSFGLRQLYDMSLFIKTNYDEINWESFYLRISEYGAVRFTKAILILLNRLFNIEIPKYILKDMTIKEDDINILLKNILSSSAHGERQNETDFHALYKLDDNDPYNYSKISRLYKFVFPKKRDLYNWFSYINGNFALIPVAWMHYIVRILKKHGIKTFKDIKQALETGKRRSDLVKIFNL